MEKTVQIKVNYLEICVLVEAWDGVVFKLIQSG